MGVWFGNFLVCYFFAEKCFGSNLLPWTVGPEPAAEGSGVWSMVLKIKGSIL